MILIDASIWIDHIHRPIAKMADLLDREVVLMHDYVIAEIALGSLPNRAAVLTMLSQLPSAVIADHIEVMNLIDSATLYGSGVGYVDVHLIASVMLAGESLLWTRDRRLKAAAQRLDIAVPDD